MSEIKEIPINAIDSLNSGENCSASEPFALRILDQSMFPEFEIDHIIIIDPSITPKNGDYVLYETNNSLIIREIKIDKNIILRAHNPNFDDISIEDMSSILGVITQRSGKRRKFHKKYN
jgi:SOS-response transcriptional repressor LexA